MPAPAPVHGGGSNAGPDLLLPGATPLTDKSALRTRMRAARGAHVAALPASTRALVMHRPPGPVLAHVPEDAAVGLYVSTAQEAPSGGYARFFHERGNVVALPWFADRSAPMEFRTWADPIGAQDLPAGPFGPQPAADADPIRPNVLFVPLLAFTLRGERLGQGGGHYDRWLEANPDAVRIGLAWDMQEVPELPVEPHDMALDMVVTPTRVLGPFR